MQDKAGNSFPGVRVRSTDGTTFWITADSLADYVLHPVFLRFLVLVILIFALLDQRPGFGAFGGWGMTFLWSVIAAVVLAWIAICSPVIAAMFRRRMIVQVYTPVLLLPMVLIVEIVIHIFTVLVGGTPWIEAPDLVRYMARNAIVVCLIDLLHANYVVHAHPLARVGKVDMAVPLPATVPERRLRTVPPRLADQPPEPADAPRVDDPVRQIAMVQIGPAALPLSSILVVRTEDHYLGVTTRSGKALHRAKMADIEELHTGLVGMQINRSVWIAYSAVKDVVEVENRQVVVQLVTGDEERISKPRVFAFRQSYAKYLLAHPPAG